MKIILLADLHFPLLTPQKLNPYKFKNTVENNFHYSRLFKLAEIINEQEPNEIYILGDFLDKADMNMCTQVVLKDFIHYLNAPVKYLNGNHERFNQQEYLLDYLDINMSPLQQNFKINNTTFTALNHNEINDAPHLTSDILLSHFRWTLPTFWGQNAELSKASLDKITENYKDIILGDIHSEYEPEDNVTYINQPYSHKYLPLSPKGFITLDVYEDGYEITRVHTYLPNKTLLNCNFVDLNKVLKSCSNVDMYKIRVNLTLEQVDKLPITNSNIKLEYVFEEKEVVKKMVIEKDTVIDTLLTVLPEDNRQFIKEILE